MAPLNDFLNAVLATPGGDREHSGRRYVDHLRLTHDLMANKNLPDYLCLAGAAHSIYGTDRFDVVFDHRNRSLLAGLIGQQAEEIAYLNCLMAMDLFDDAVKVGRVPHTLINRLDGCMMPIDAQEFSDLCAVHHYEWVEQLSNGHAPYNGHERMAVHQALARTLGTTEDYEEALRARTSWLQTVLDSGGSIANKFGRLRSGSRLQS